MNYKSLKPLALAVGIALLATACGQQADSADKAARFVDRLDSESQI